MVYISNKDEFYGEIESNTEEGENKESQYLLKVIYDSEDKNVHKLLEGIFGPDQMLNVKNGKVAKVNSTLTPQERDNFLEMVKEALNKFEKQKEKGIVEKNTKEEIKEQQTSRKVSAEKLMKEFSEFINNIS